MVNAPTMMRQQRLARIASVQASIEKAKKEKQELSFEKLVIAAMSALGVSKPIAFSYVEVALYNLGIDVKDLKP